MAARPDMIGPLDVARLRQDFPILSRRIRGRPLVYLDNAASSQRPRAVIDAGADFAYMGTRFINTAETRATDEYLQMISDAGSSDVVYTAAISGVHANFLGASLKAAGLTEEDLKKDTKIDFGKELDTEAKAWKTIWSAGQGSAMIDNSIPVAELVATLKSEFRSAIEEQAKVLEMYPK